VENAGSFIPLPGGVRGGFVSVRVSVRDGVKVFITLPSRESLKE